MQYKLPSNRAVHSPSILKYFLNGYKFENDREAILSVFVASYPGIPADTAHRLLSGEIAYQIEGEDVVFEDAVLHENQHQRLANS